VKELEQRDSSDTVSIRLRFTGHGTMQASAAVPFGEPSMTADAPTDPVSRGGGSVALTVLLVIAGLFGVGLLCGGIFLILLLVSMKKRVGQLHDSVCPSDSDDIL
jgi:hypothetical protein